MCKFLSPGFCLLTLLVTNPLANAEVNARILETGPPAPVTLGKMEWLNIRVFYTADEEVIFSPDSYYKDKRVFDENHFLVSGFRPPGSGEAAVAIAFTDSRRVDLLKVFAWSRSGRVIGEMSLPVDIRWTGRAPATAKQTPDWARGLEDQQIEQARKAATPQSWTWSETALGMAATVLMFGAVPAYFVLQVIALWRLRSGWLKASLLPVIPMILVLVYTIDAYNKESNLWPIVLIFSSPVAAAYVLAILVIHRISERARGAVAPAA
ncbi:MAG TPA: hypothetical protein VMH05_26120 [Bryobacteraceae bacterium]|nr:hypothetical protein [Bryobacteraceae bacterium]